MQDLPKDKGTQIFILEQKEKECSSYNYSVEQFPGYCPTVWDGIMCWPSTPPETLLVIRCPDYFAGFIQGNASKHCMEDGTWYVGSDNAPWTNFTQCMPGKDRGRIITYFNRSSLNITHSADHLDAIKTISIIGYSISLVTLFVALVILFSFKRLRCPRNTLHAHLFVSFMLRAGVSLLKHSLTYQGVGLSNEVINLDGDVWITDTEVSWSCKFLSTLWQYFILANYSWLLMEGLYLHNLIFLALFSDTSAITSYIVLGWSGPLAVIIPWLIVRLTKDNEFCWTTHSKTSYFIIEVPIIVSILVNFVLFLNIVRVLHLKLTASISEEQRRFRYRRWAKSTLVLVPLFGVHYVFFVWYIPIEKKKDWAELTWLLVDQIFSSSQGSVVAVLYCFMNGEVRAEIVKKWRKMRENKKPGYRITNYRPSRLFNQRKMSTRQCNNSTVVDSSMHSFMSSGPSERRLTHTQITEITTQNDIPNATSRLVYEKPNA